jgi:hypothetical protein
MSIISNLVTKFPRVAFGLVDYHMYVEVGSRGMTVGPCFLSLDKNGDIAHQLISPPEGFQYLMSDISFEWESKSRK